MIYKTIIIGSGPAGLTAAIYAARAELQPLVIAGAMPGGQLMLTTEVENFPGFPEGIMGPALMDSMRKQTERFGATFIDQDATGVSFEGVIKKVTVGAETYEAKTVIIATGASAIWLGIPSEQKFMGHGVGSCATCDGFFYKNKKVLVIGGGDTAIEEALFLTKYATSVIIVHRRNALRASKIQQEKAFANPKIDFLWDTELVEVLGDAKVSAAKLKNVKTGELTQIAADGIFVAIGHNPNTKIFQGQVTMDEKGYIIPQKLQTHTNREGVFVAGDVSDHRYRPAISAAGIGCMAAMDAEKYLETHKD